MFEEKRRRAIEERMPRQFGLADQADELEIRQRLDVRRDVHAANRLDLALRERLAIGDDRQRLQRGAPQPVRTIHLQKRTHIPPAARLRLETVRAARTDETEAAAGDLEGLLHAANRLGDLLRRARAIDVHDLLVLAVLGLDGLHGLAQLRRRQRRLAREEKRAHDFLQGARQRNLHLVTHSRPVSPKACRPAPRGTAES